METRGWALAVQMSAAGRTQLGSSKLLAWRDIMAGYGEGRASRGEPHVGQKPRETEIARFSGVS